MTTVDQKTRHIWARMATGKVRCADHLCNARPDPADIAKLETEETQRRAMRMEIRYSHWSDTETVGGGAPPMVMTDPPDTTDHRRRFRERLRVEWIDGAQRMAPSNRADEDDC